MSAEQAERKARNRKEFGIGSPYRPRGAMPTTPLAQQNFKTHSGRCPFCFEKSCEHFPIKKEKGV